MSAPSAPQRVTRTLSPRMPAWGGLLIRAGAYEAGFVGEDDCLYAVAEVEFREHARDVRFHG